MFFSNNLVSVYETEFVLREEAPSSRVDGLIWHNIWKLPHKYLITNKVK